MGKLSYLNFDIRITANGGGYWAYVLDSPAGQADASFGVPLTGMESVFVAEGDGVPNRTSKDRRAIELGRALFEALFHDDVLVCLEKSLVEVRSQGVGLRIKLRLNEASTLTELPWECLYHPGWGRFLALSNETPLVHFLDLPRKAPPLLVTPPLRILAMIASPSDQPRLDGDAEWAHLQSALTEPLHRGAISMERVEAATLGCLQGALRRKDYHVFHFIGHGGFEEATGEGYLVFADQEGRSDVVQAQDLATLLGNSRSLRLVVLNACKGGSGRALDPFSGTAQTLVRQGIPAVIAMQAAISDQAAIAFSQEFYAALADGYPVDAAATEARIAISRQARGEWAIPRLVMHASDGLLWQIETVPVSMSPSPIQAVDRGLTILAAFAQAPQVREIAAAFRADFQATAEQINVLGDYKDLHDLLHNFQFLCYNVIVGEAQRFPGDEVSVGNLANYELTFRDIVSQLQQVAARPSMPTTEAEWIGELVVAQANLHDALETLTAEPLKRAIWLSRRVLDRHPSRINDRLYGVARALRLSAIEQGLVAIRESLDSSSLEPAKLQQFSNGVQSLSVLRHRLEVLTGSHDQWQALDQEFRRVEAAIGQDLTELQMSWPDLKRRSASLCHETESELNQPLCNEADALEVALTAGSPVKIRLAFQRYRRLAGTRFYQVDAELKALCGELRSVGEPLAAVLRVLL